MKTIEQLQEENAALMAQVEALRASFSEQTKAFALWMNDFDALTQELGIEHRMISINDLRKHLREIRAEAGRAGFVAGFKRRTALGPLRKMWSEEEIIELYNQYADSIRRGEVE